MSVLSGFPSDVQYEVEVAKIWYGDKFKRRMRDPRYQHYWRVNPEDLLIVYIVSVWRVFLREADTRRLWRAADVNSKALEFLRQLTKDLYFEKGFDYEERRLPAMLAIDGVILDRVMEKFLRCGTWRYFEEVRLRAAEPATQHAAALDSSTERAANVAEQLTVEPAVEQIMSGEVVPPPAPTPSVVQEPSPTSEESAETPDELSYDENTQVLKFCETTFTGVGKFQYAVIKYLYDLDASSAGAAEKELVKAAGLNPDKNRLQNLFQRKKRRLYNLLIAYSRQSRLYSFKPPRNRPARISLPALTDTL